MRFLRRGPADGADATQDVVEPASPEPRTAGKGRPTPSRREAQGRKRGPVPPPPRNQREALRRMRSSKEDRRKASATRRERMMAGDERYLMPRDRGPDKAYARDLVDSRRNVMGLFMPLAVFILLTILVPSPALQQFASVLTTAMLLTMVVEGTLLGRYVNRQVRTHFPDTRSSRIGLGLYAFTRATQLRRLRVPKPRHTPTDPVKAPARS